MAEKGPTKFKIQTIFCPWCHGPLVFIKELELELAGQTRTADRYDCANRESHTILVMPRLT